DEDKADIADAVQSTAVNGVIISNTTIARPDVLRNAHAGEAGGLSGKPLFQPSTDLLSEFYRRLEGATPLIGVGGVASARDAYEKVLAGASLVQLYTALVYQGPRLPSDILKALPAFLEADGFRTVADAVGAACR
ncbi:MAG: dihydroorotate dehydrogenase, partial [Hyphococcus sp.]